MAVDESKRILGLTRYLYCDNVYQSQKTFTVKCNIAGHPDQIYKLCYVGSRTRNDQKRRNGTRYGG